MGQTGAKYPKWGEFLKRARLVRYRSAREFCAKENVGISYPQYSRYEAGDQLPNLDQAIKLFHLLRVHVLEGILEWSLSQMKSGPERDEVSGTLKDVKTYRERRERLRKNQTPEEPVVSPESTEKSSGFTETEELPSLFERPSISLDQVIVFNRSHLKLFQSNPLYRDIFTYVNSYAPDWIGIEELSLALGAAMSEVEKMVDDLNDHGVLLVAGGKCRSSKKTFYFPDDEEFFELRNQNLSWNSQKIIENITHDALMSRKAFRGVITRELTLDQIKKVIQGIEDLIENMIRMPESTSPDRIYSLCMLFGERFSRTKSIISQHLNHGIAPGLTKSIAEAGIETQTKEGTQQT